MRTSQQLRMEAVEEQVLGGIDLAVEALDRTLRALQSHDPEAAAAVIADDDELDERCGRAHAAIVALLALEAPVASNLRATVALLDAVRRTERIGDLCVTIAKLVELDGEDPDDDAPLLDAVALMGGLAREQLLIARRALERRDPAAVLLLRERDRQLDALERDVFRRGVEIGGAPGARRWAMHMTLVARALERIGANAVGIAARAAFAVTGRPS